MIRSWTVARPLRLVFLAVLLTRPPTPGVGDQVAVLSDIFLCCASDVFLFQTVKCKKLVQLQCIARCTINCVISSVGGFGFKRLGVCVWWGLLRGQLSSFTVLHFESQRARLISVAEVRSCFPRRSETNLACTLGQVNETVQAHLQSCESKHRTEKYGACHSKKKSKSCVFSAPLDKTRPPLQRFKNMFSVPIRLAVVFSHQIVQFN